MRTLTALFTKLVDDGWRVTLRAHGEDKCIVFPPDEYVGPPEFEELLSQTSDGDCYLVYSHGELVIRAAAGVE